MPRLPRRSNSDKIAFASACPSSGSVPPPSSSMSARLFASARARMPMILLIWEENVDRFSSIDCASPISQKIDAKTETSVPSAAGRNRPQHAIMQNSPHIFSVTVLPPVFGPEINKKRSLPPKASETGIAVFGSRSG